MLKKSSLFLLAAVMLGGCYNMRTNSNESADKITFGESLEHYLLFAHDCRRSPQECNPVCREDVEKFSRNVKAEKAKWEAFKNTRPYIYVRKNIPLVDPVNKLLARLSAQIKTEVVVPMITLDSQGHVEAYRTFQADVDYMMDTLKIDRKSAVQRVYSYWEKRYGAEKCRQLFEALPLIERARADRQLLAALIRNRKELSTLIFNANKEWKKLNWQILRDTEELNRLRKQGVNRETLQRAAAALESLTAKAMALGETLTIARQFSETLAYLAVFEKQNMQKAKDIEAALKDIQRVNKN